MFFKKKLINTFGFTMPDALIFSIGAAALSSQALAIGVSDAKFIELGGSLSSDQATVRKVYDHLNRISREPRFDAVGRILTGRFICTATWLGNEGNNAVILTAAHCLHGDDRSQESIYTGQDVSFRTGDGRLIASGIATTHFIGYTGCNSDIAIVKAPLLTSPINSQGDAVPKPVIADAPDFDQHVGKPMSLAGYGIQGTPSLGEVSSGRAYGLGRISREVNGCLRNLATTEEAWAFGASGDSGSTSWQWREGQFVGVGVASWWFGWAVPESGHARIAPHQAWMKKTYPEINTVTRTRTLTETESVILNDVEAQVKGTVYYLEGNNVSGPTSPKWDYPGGFSALSVPMVNQTTGQTHNIELRAQRQTWCGWGEINNGAYCYPDANKGGLKVWFDASDNVAAPAGLYQADFSLLAQGWHDHSYNADIELKANILVEGDSEPEGIVTASSSANTVRYDSTVNGSVYYLPEGNIQSDASGRDWSGQHNTWSSLEVPAVNKNSKESASVVLRASRNVGCGWSAMNNGVDCSNGANNGQLRISYHPEDNTALPTGDYETLFNIRAHGWHSSFNELLTFKLNVEKGLLVTEESGASIPSLSDALVQADSTSSTVTLVESSKQNVVSDTVHVMAPEFGTVDAYLADVEGFLPVNSNTELVDKREAPPVIFDTEVTLWHSVSSAKPVFENYGSVNLLSEEHFIEFDESSLGALEVGQRFILPKLGETRLQVIVKQQEDWEHGSTNWVLMDNQGKPAGSLTKTQDGVEGIFQMPDGAYHLLTRNGVGWIAHEATLINASEQVIMPLDKY